MNTLPTPEHVEEVSEGVTYLTCLQHFVTVVLGEIPHYKLETLAKECGSVGSHIINIPDDKKLFVTAFWHAEDATKFLNRHKFL